jgi:hypothetical protein
MYPISRSDVCFIYPRVFRSQCRNDFPHHGEAADQVERRRYDTDDGQGAAPTEVDLLEMHEDKQRKNGDKCRSAP